MTRAESILVALEALAASALPTVKVVRSRTSRFGESELPALNIKPDIDQANSHANSLNKHEFNVGFDLHLVPQDVPDSAADPYVSTLHQAITDSSALIDLVSKVQYKSRQWQFDDGDDSAVKLTIIYAFTYINLNNQL